MPLLTLPLTAPSAGFSPLTSAHGELRGLLGLGLDRLVDGHELLAGDDALDAGELGVLAGDGGASGSKPAAFMRRDGAARGAVVGGVDADEAVLAQRGDGLLHLLLGLVRAPVGRVVLLTILTLAVEDVCAPFLNRVALLSVGEPLIMTMLGARLAVRVRASSSSASPCSLPTRSLSNET